MESIEQTARPEEGVDPTCTKIFRLYVRRSFLCKTKCSWANGRVDTDTFLLVILGLWTCS